MRTVIRWLCTFAVRQQVLMPTLLYIIIAGVFSAPLFATVNSGEIIPSSVSATRSSTFDPINGYSVTFRWTTVHRSNSIVVIENSDDYRGSTNYSSRQIVQNDYVTNHTVVVDHFPAYSYSGTWGYYVASRQQGAAIWRQPGGAIWRQPGGIGSPQPSGTWATYPGPATPACNSLHIPGCGGSYLTFNLPTAPTNPNGTLVFTLWPIGGQNVYQGDPAESPACTPTEKNSRECNDLYIALQANLMSGPSDRTVQIQNVVISNTDTGRRVTDNSVTAQYLCNLGAPSNPPPPGWDGAYNLTNNSCYNATLYSTNTTLRLRVNSRAVPAHYQATARFQAQYGGVNYGNPVAVTYNFMVLPKASFTPTPPGSFPEIAGLATWQSNMVNPTPYPGHGGTPYRSGEFWCTDNKKINPWWSLDNGNFAGYFDLPSSIFFEAWNYDGGRVYQQISDYDYNVLGMPGYQNPAHRDHWKRCTELALEPYKDTALATKGGFIWEANQFPYGLAMNYLRTGDPTMQQAVNVLAAAPMYNLSAGSSPYVSFARIGAYVLDNRLAAEIAGASRSPLVPREVDVLLGYLDQSYNFSVNNPNQQQYRVLPFAIGLVMEALINYYELDEAEGNAPDARIPLEIKKVLDWWYSTQYIASTHTLAYQPYNVPVDFTLVGGNLYGATSLNDLVSPAYAWYWSKNGDNRYLAEGDDLFNHVFDDAMFYNPTGLLDGGWTWSVKEFNQIYKWSFDYVRWRTGQNPDGSFPAVGTVQAAANPCDNGSHPCVAPGADHTTPVQFLWGPGVGTTSPTMNPVLSNASVTATTAMFRLNTFKPNVTLTVYYGTAAPTACNLNNPQPPNCMQPFPNFGFQAMLSANYPYRSTTTGVVQDQTAVSQGVLNVYDATVTITGLRPNTTYHWRPLTTDASGNMAAYHDQTFTTGAH